MRLGNYWGNIVSAATTLATGLTLTFRHMLRARRSKTATDITKPGYFEGQQGIATITFPHESIPVPDNGRYQLHNEIDDCIVCDKCAKICPVNCIDIEPIKSPAEFGKTSDGTSKRIYAARFDIDMAKCCFCGLCTTVCPTECLTMTPKYDYTVTNIAEHNFAFGNLSLATIEEKKQEWESHQKTKAAPVTSSQPETPAPSTTPAAAKPVFKPRIKPPGSTQA